MDFYKLKNTIVIKIRLYLEHRQKCSEDETLTPISWTDFERELILEYGVTPKMIRTLFETIIPQCTIINGEIVKK